MESSFGDDAAGRVRFGAKGNAAGPVFVAADQRKRSARVGGQGSTAEGVAVMGRKDDPEIGVLDALHSENRTLKYGLGVAVAVVVSLSASQAWIATRPKPAPLTFAVNQMDGNVWRIASGEKINYSEMMMKGQIASYVKMCETYVYDGLAMFHDYCVLHSGPERQQQYLADYDGGPDSRQVKWGRDRVIRVDTEPDPIGTKGGVPLTINLRSANTAYVWFTTEEKFIGGGKPVRQNWGVEIVYRILSDVKMKERDMLTNYTLFEVVSYTKERLP